MSESMYRSQLDRHLKQKADLEKKRADELKKSADVQRDLGRIVSSLNSSSMSTSTFNQKTRQAADKQKKLADHAKKLSGYDSDLARVAGQITTTQSSLNRAIKSRQDKEASEAKRQRETEAKHLKEMERLRRKSADDADRERRRALDHQRNLTAETRRRSQLYSPHLTVASVQRLPEKIKVLFVAANPQDQEKLRLDEESRDVTRRIQMARYGRSVEVISIWAVRPEDLMEALSEHEPHVVHFSGHGSDRDEIVFLDKAGNTKLVSKAAITATIGTTADHVRLIVFNTCYSRNQAEAVTAHIDVAIGMRTAIGDEAARVFAAAFYSAIGYGYSVERAFDKARAEVMLQGIPEEDTPELFAREGVDPDEIVLVRPGPDAMPEAA